MKKNQLALRGIVFLAALLCTAALCVPCCAQAEAGWVEPCVSWDTDVEQMLALEGAAKATPQKVNDTDLMEYFFTHMSETGVAEAFVAYVFRDEKLAVLMCVPDPCYAKENAGTEASYTEQLALLTGVYGEPSLTDPQRVIQLNTALGGADEEYLGYAGWDLADGVSLHLVYNATNSVYYLYSKDARLLGEEE